MRTQITNDEELFEALEDLYHMSAFPSISEKAAKDIEEIKEQLIILGITDDEGIFTKTVLGKRAHDFEDNYYC